MDNIEITVFDEITDYKEKIYFFNFRQWVFTILIGILVIPTYIIFKDKIGEEITSYIVIAIAGILGFIGFVKIHELPAEKILPFWFRHYFSFAKPIVYMTDEQFEIQKQQKKNKVKRRNLKQKKQSKKNTKTSKIAKRSLPKNKTVDKKKEIKKDEVNKENELVEQLSKLSKEQKDALLKLLER